MSEFWQSIQIWLNAPYVLALGIFVGFFGTAKLADIIVSRLLQQLAQRTKTDLDDRLVEIMHRPVFQSVVLVGIYFAINVIHLSAPFDFISIALLKTLAILLWTSTGFKLAHLLLTMISRISQRVTWIDIQTLPLFENLAKLLILGVTSYLFLLTWDINVSAWLASAGIIGIALGMAAKDTLANLFGGMSIMADAPYKMDDFIILDSGERGRVTHIGLRSTRILTRDDVEITIPNAVIANAKITNESGGPSKKERIRATVGVAYGSDLDQVRHALHSATQVTEHIAHTPAPRIRFREFGESALIFQVMCWVDEPVLRGRALDSLNEQIYRNLNESNITIPFPQRDVHLHDTSKH